MKVVSVHEAKTHLSRLIREVEEAEEVVISRGNVPRVRLVLVEEAGRQRRIGSAKGLIEFDEPLEDFAGYQ